MKILVVGGAGYIGSHMVKMLGSQGCKVTTLDIQTCGYRERVLFGDYIQGNCGDRFLMDQVLTDNFDAVMHFASFISVGESVENPKQYYKNNLVNTITLLDAMVDNGVKNFIFSSTAATFGTPRYSPIDEKHRQDPINPYGRTKLMVEQVLADYDHAYGLKSVCLRYFNAAGADPDGDLGECHEPETHLIPLALQVASGRRPSISVFGRDYETPDGTCIRDYIHVHDLCYAHWLALKSLMGGASSQSYNLGNGNGFSVQEVIDASESVTGRSIKVVESVRRPGDPDRLIADSSLARSELGWAPRYTRLETIIEHAWNWEKKLVLVKKISPDLEL